MSATDRGIAMGADGCSAVLAGLIAIACVLSTASVRAAESYDSCNGYIDALPATITTAGIWCLRADLTTAMTSGTAIFIDANNVVLDCNDFKLGGLAAGSGSSTYGVHVNGRLNATIRHCAVRGFYIGISSSAGGGHVIEDNRVEGSLYAGIFLNDSPDSLVRRNSVFDTGGAPSQTTAIGIYATGDVVENTVSGVTSTASPVQLVGINLVGLDTSARDNQVRGVFAFAAGDMDGIRAFYGRHALVGNQVANAYDGAGYGIRGSGGATVCRDNRVGNFATAISGCVDAGGNDGH